MLIEKYNHPHLRIHGIKLIPVEMRRKTIDSASGIIRVALPRSYRGNDAKKSQWKCLLTAVKNRTSPKRSHLIIHYKYFLYWKHSRSDIPGQKKFQTQGERHTGTSITKINNELSAKSAVLQAAKFSIPNLRPFESER